MTIVLDAPVQQLYYRGHDNPAFPTGIWWASATQVGDASGGFMAVRAEFHAEGDAKSGDIFNLEQVSGLVSAASVLEGFLETVGMAPQPGLPAFDRFWHVTFEDMDASLGNVALGAKAFTLLPLFIGTLRGESDSNGNLTLAVTNLGASDSISASFLGYRWGPRSIMAPGGPQRPPFSLFGRGG